MDRQSQRDRIDGPRCRSDASLNEGPIGEGAADIADLAQGLLRDACFCMLRSMNSRVPAVSPLAFPFAGPVASPYAVQAVYLQLHDCSRREGMCGQPVIDHAELEEVLNAGAASITLLTTQMAGTGCPPHENVQFRTETPPEPEMVVSVEPQQGHANGEFLSRRMPA